jgi:ABC-type multidrug transport system ATPase subunit
VGAYAGGRRWSDAVGATRETGVLRDRRGMNETGTVVEVSGLTKRYGKHLAVDGVDLSVRRGEVYGFLGPNGAGKTTTLRILTGLITPSSGTVSVLGGQPGDSAVLARTGSLIESPALYPYLSGRDNLRVLARYASVPKARVEEVLELVDLADRAGDRFSTYSLGMKQRLGVAAALLKEPDLVILDEPTNGLDPAGMRDMRELVRNLGTDGRTVVLSSHLLGEVQQICDRVGIISEGRMVAERTVGELRGQHELVIAADPVDDARRRLKDLLGTEAVRTEDHTLRVQVERESVAKINRMLVEAGIAVTELRTAERALEDVFFELTSRRETTDVR